jgi:hypothetical protein
VRTLVAVPVRGCGSASSPGAPGPVMQGLLDTLGPVLLVGGRVETAAQGGGQSRRAAAA